MTKEQYLKSLKRHLNVSTEKKNEIMDDIEADIEEALASGESMDELVKRMGSPKKLASEFNQNLGAKPQRWPWVIGVLVFIIVVGGGWLFFNQSNEKKEETSPSLIQTAMGTSGKFDQEVVREKSLEIIDLMESGQYEMVYETYFPENMKQAMSLEQFKQSSELALGMGDMQEIKQEYYAEITQNGVLYGVSEIHVSCANGTLAYRISFTEDMTLGGFYVLQV